MPIDIIGIPIPEPTAHVIGGGVATLVLGIALRAVASMFSKGKKEFAADRAEETQIKRLEKEVERVELRAGAAMTRADAAFVELNKCVEREARSQGLIEGLRLQVSDLRAEVQALRELLVGR